MNNGMNCVEEKKDVGPLRTAFIRKEEYQKERRKKMTRKILLEVFVDFTRKLRMNIGEILADRFKKFHIGIFRLFQLSINMIERSLCGG